MKSTILRALAMPLGFLVGGIIALPIAHVVMDDQPTSHSLADEPNLGRPSVKNSPGWLVEKHDCWTGAAPAEMEGKMPGHVVVTVDNVARLGGDRLVGKALEQIFESKDHDLIVHGFCR